MVTEEEIYTATDLLSVCKKDPYLIESVAFSRLLMDYDLHKKIIVALDFDDTIYDFHGKGSTYHKVISLIKECNELEFPVVIFTANNDHNFIKGYCDNIGIKIEGINKNVISQFEGCGKIYYNILLDDRAGLGEAVRILTNLINLINLIKE
jgi:Icc-related predicted phosphoesterase